MADVIVIGAGWGGLTAAAILAHHGLEVEVMEATAHIGGRSACDRKDGFLVDYGIHIISYGPDGPAARALREIGYDIDFAYYGKPLLYIDGSFIPMPTGTASFLASDYLSWADKVIIGHGVRRLIVSKTGKIADKPLLDAIPGRRREEVRNFFRVLSAMGLVDPDIEVASAGEFAKFLRRAMRARVQVSYPRGGTRQINEALAAKIAESGKISFNTRAKGLNIQGGMVKGVRVHDEVVSAPAVVFALPVQKLPHMVAKALPAEYLQGCSDLIPTAGISVDLCLSRRVSDIDSFIITPDPIVMGQFTSNIDETVAPEGKQLATFFYSLPMEVMKDRVRLEAEQKRLGDLLETMFEGITEAVEWERVLRLNMVDGFEPRVGQTDKDRPSTRVPDVENLFLAGDCVGVPGKGGDVAFTSGVAAAHAVLDFLG